MVKMALAATVAAGAGAAFAQEADAQENAAPAAAAEVVNDGGVEAVRQADEAAPKEPPVKVKNAKDEVTAWVKGKKWRQGWDAKKKRFVRIEMAQFDCDDPAKAQNVMVQRDMAVKRAVLQAKMEIIESVKTIIDADDYMEMSGGNPSVATGEAKAAAAQRVQELKQYSTAKFMAEMPLFGATCVRQSESWNKGK